MKSSLFSYNIAAIAAQPFLQDFLKCSPIATYIKQFAKCDPLVTHIILYNTVHSKNVTFLLHASHTSTQNM